MKRKIWAAATMVLGLTGQTLGAGLAGADEPATHVDSVSAVGDGADVSVTGTAVFVDALVQVAEDPTGDASPGGLGTDLTKATISRPNAAKNELHFTMEIADEIPQAFALPEVIHYSFFFAVGPDAASQWLLMGLRTSQAQAPGSTGPVLSLHQFRANGTCCDPRGMVTGSMSGGKILWVLPMSMIQAKTGTLIEPHPARAIQIQIGASGQQRLNSNQPDQMFSETTYTVPGPSVELGIAPAETPESEVPLSVTATVNAGSGAFSGKLTRPTESGSYIVVAKACYGSGNCGIKSTTITI